MTTKAEFDAAEWQRVSEGPAIAGLIVITAQRGGTLRESISMAKAYAEAGKEQGKSDLLGEIVAAGPRVEPQRFGSAEALRSEGLDQLREAVELLERKASPEELADYREFAIAVAQGAAEADKSGGVMGIGGERVSEAESAALAEIAEALGTQPSTTQEAK